MIKEFIEWFDENSIEILHTFVEIIIKALKSALLVMVVILTSPVWIIPFIYWWFKIYTKKE